jgi:ankyrin
MGKISDSPIQISRGVILNFMNCVQKCFIILLLGFLCVPSVLVSDTSSTEYLIFSVERGYVNHTKKAIASGGNVNGKDYFKKTPLIYAADGGYFEIVQILLKHGAANSIHARDRDGNTAIFYARKKGHNAIVDLLLQYGAKDD